MQYIQKLAELIANITESYSSAIFLNNSTNLEQNSLKVAGYHSLSDDFIPECEITAGSGLVGWALENAKNISVCPFKHDATTLLYYKKDQALKSFIAIPIIEKISNGGIRVHGVIACDSKKSYAFAKVTEKILFETSELLLQHLKTAISSQKKSIPQVSEDVEKTISSQLKKIDNEAELLKLASILTKESIECETLAVVTSPTSLHSEKVYCEENSQKNQHNLMQLALRQKRSISSNKSIQTKSSINKNASSFLSVPFKVLDQDAGSFNFLSRPGIPFSARQIKIIENIARNTGESLEKIRLKQRAKAFSNNENVVSWNHFVTIAKEQIAKAVHNKEDLTLSRITIGSLEKIENQIGIAQTQELLASIFRIIQQLIRYPAISCKLIGTDILIIAESSEALAIHHRLNKLLSKIDKPQISKIITDEISISSATTNVDGSSFSELIRKVQVKNQYTINETQIKESQKAIA